MFNSDDDNNNEWDTPPQQPHAAPTLQAQSTPLGHGALFATPRTPILQPSAAPNGGAVPPLVLDSSTSDAPEYH